jgi:chromosome segregation ATPase
MNINSAETFFELAKVGGGLSGWDKTYAQDLIDTVKTLSNKLLDKENEIASLKEVLILNKELLEDKDNIWQTTVDDLADTVNDLRMERTDLEGKIYNLEDENRDLTNALADCQQELSES